MLSWFENDPARFRSIFVASKAANVPSLNARRNKFGRPGWKAIDDTAVLEARDSISIGELLCVKFFRYANGGLSEAETKRCPVGDMASATGGVACVLAGLKTLDRSVE